MFDEDKAARTLFDGAKDHGDAERAIERNAMENELLTPAQATQRAEAWRGEFQALGLSSTESARLADLKGHPTDEQRKAWQEDSRKALVQDFGPDGAGQALADTKAYLQKQPALRDYLRKTGLGDHPSWVRTVAVKARQARAAGKLG